MPKTNGSNLTDKQEAFALKYVECNNASQAYRHAYNTENMKDEVIHVKACELKKSGNVAVRILELQEHHREKHEITIEYLTQELKNALQLGKDEKLPNAMVSALKEMSVLHGLRVEKREDTIISHEDRLIAMREKLAASQPTKH